MNMLIGRDADLACIEELLFGSRSCRIVTVTGPSGIGKSRLLRELTDRARATGRNVVVPVADRPRPRLRPVPTLLVVDDLDTSPASLRRWLTLVLDRLPHVQAVVTAMSPLLLPGERVHALPRLAVEPDCVALFGEAAERLGCRPSDPAQVAALCAELGGLPLAVLCAAELAPAVPPGYLLHRLAEARLLDELGGIAPAGGRTLRAAAERTHAALSDADRRLLARLSVLPATFPPAAAVAVAGLPEEGDVLAGLARLTSAGVLIRRGWGGGAPRLALGRAVRELAREQLTEPAAVIAARTRYHREVAGAARVRYDRGDEAGALAVLESEWAGLRGSVDDLAAAGDLGIALEIAVRAALVPLVCWYDAGSAARLGELRAAAEDAGAGSPELRAEAQLLSARLAVEYAADLPSPDGPLVAGLLSAVAAARAGGDRHLLATAIEFALDVLLDVDGAVACRPLIGEALALDLADDARARIEAWSAAVEAVAGQVAQAQQLMERAYERAPGVGPLRALVAASARLAAVLPVPDGAVAPERLLAEARALRDKHTEIRVLTMLARAAFERGAVDEAARRADEALETAQALGAEHVGGACAGALAVLVDCAAAWDEPFDALRLHEAVAGLAPRAMAAALGRAALGHRERVDMLRETLGERRSRRAAREAAGWSLPDAVRAACALAGRWSPVPTDLGGDDVVQAAIRDAAGEPHELLTRRQQEVLRHLARGATNKEIGVALGMSPKTVMHHSGAIYRKLGAHTRAEAAVLAIRHGLLSAQD